MNSGRAPLETAWASTVDVEAYAVLGQAWGWLGSAGAAPVHVVAGVDVPSVVFRQ